MGPTTAIDEKTLEILKRDEPKIIRALEIYYSRFDTDGGITFQGAALKAGANPAYMVDYMFYRGNLGMPSDREEALGYLDNLKRRG